MKTLYVSDMDGTLLDNDSRVSLRSAGIISDLSRRGILITVATARTPATVDPLMRDTYTCCPAIVMTGAALWDREKRELVDMKLLSSEAFADIRQVFAMASLDPFIYTVASPARLDVYHGLEMSPGEESFYMERSHLVLKKFHLGDCPSADETGRVILMFGIGDTDRVAGVAEALEGRGDCSVSFYPDILSPSRSLIEVFASGVSKAGAVKKLADRLGADRIVVYGDNLNDLSMMAVADEAVAVANAFPEVRAAATRVIGPNSDDAVARDIRDLTDFKSMSEFNGTKDSESMSETAPVSDDGVMGFHNDRFGDRNRPDRLLKLKFC